MTLAELLVASLLMTMIVAAVAAMAKTVQVGADYTYGEGEVTQHARVVVERIERAVRNAVATANDPGFCVVTHTSGAFTIRDTLAVWTADTNRDGVPQLSEVIVYTPNHSAPNELLELKFPSDTTTVSLTSPATLKTLIDARRSNPARTQVSLTKLVRTAVVPVVNETKACLLFVGEIVPDAQQYQDGRTDVTTWEDLPWPQGLRGNKRGVRQAWVRFELQLTPSENAATITTNNNRVTAFFGSAALYYELQK